MIPVAGLMVRRYRHCDPARASPCDTASARAGNSRDASVNGCAVRREGMKLTKRPGIGSPSGGLQNVLIPRRAGLNFGRALVHPLRAVLKPSPSAGSFEPEVIETMSAAFVAACDALHLQI